MSAIFTPRSSAVWGRNSNLKASGGGRRGGEGQDTYDIDTLIPGHTDFGALGTQVNTDDAHRAKGICAIKSDPGRTAMRGKEKIWRGREKEGRKAWRGGFCTARPRLVELGRRESGVDCSRSSSGHPWVRALKLVGRIGQKKKNDSTTLREVNRGDDGERAARERSDDISTTQQGPELNDGR